MSRLPLTKIISEYETVSKELATTTETARIIELGKKIKQLGAQHDLAQKITRLEQTISGNNEALADTSLDDELREMMELENSQAVESITQYEEELLGYLAPPDPRDDENCILEIRAGAGGDESSLFAGELINAYRAMASELGISAKVIESSSGTMGGYKEVVVELRGEQPYSWYKYEGGVHRVQRVPITEKQGRVHTSTVSVAVMPLIETNNDFKLNPADIEIVISTSSGNGGQSVNTTYSAVRMRHTPTGIEAQSQDERDQQQNRIKALQVLTSRVFDRYEEERLAKESAERRAQVGRADRSEKIRTYNFPQDRLTDHRYNRNWNQLPVIMSGGILQVVQDIKKMVAEQALANF